MNSASKFLVVSIGVLGFACGWLWRGPVVAPSTEAPAPAQRQADGSLVLARADGAKAPPPAPHAIPQGAKEERRVQVVVKPALGVVVSDIHAIADPAEASRLSAGALEKSVEFSDGSPIDSCDCPPVTVDLSLVRLKDKTRRVVASSPDGQILSGLDIPIEAAPEVRIPRWTLSAVAVADLEGIRPGALLQRRLGPVVLGAGAFVSPVNLTPAGIVSAGITW